ncbi:MULTISPECIES: DUF1501 domain-containing protein [Inquilinus]|jgi:uncharacterized protein (DUF1501 family)|uniref:Uncharacterized protein (DUF1501 family) n=1 Tax=Inquilinus ginsengisoli TaxID=363840 RepID=A0ABU1JTU2_9PROT|nr:DUF1501 domain-containing protein [Inquilinus ginsengisoli]MDR6292022.1 uncharacterized protein (DUF1501 family) [Inquilinus ginsengisoli]
MILTRRHLLGGLAATAAATTLPARLLLAKAPIEQRFVLIILRGALDGLAAVPPYGDPDYRTLHGALAPPDPAKDGGMVDLDGHFALHPGLAPLKQWYTEGSLLPLHAVASPYRDRSHFDGQDLLETGAAKLDGTRDGWLNRTLGLIGATDRRFGIAFAEEIPLVLRGSTAVTSWLPDRPSGLPPGFPDLVSNLYDKDPALHAAYVAGLDTTAFGKQMQDMAQGGANARGAGGDAALAQAAGKFLADPAGSRIAVMELYGWDTHVLQVKRLNELLASYAATLQALRTGLGPAWKQTTILTVTEFGRTAAANGSGGTDHGTGSIALLAGGAVHGGRVLADWPGLSKDKLYQARDLAPTTDLRAVVKGVFRDHLGLPEDALNRVVFPGSTEAAAMHDLVKKA